MKWSDSETVSALLVRLAKCFDPPDRITPSGWAEQRRRLSPEASAKKGGAFSFRDAPWQRDVLDSIVDRTVGSVVLIWASQTAGKTETINNMVGYMIDVDPCPILSMQPTGEMAETYSKDRLVPMIRDTPSLVGKVKDPRSRDSGNTILHKKFPGGHITIVGSNAPAALASRPIRAVFFDEVDRYPPSAGTEGDPVFLAEKRTESFSDAITIKTSTPTTTGYSRIEKEFATSDKRYWFCPCPKCGHWQTLEWGMVRWQNDDPDTARIECKECRELLTEDQRQAMVRAGVWRATAEFRGVVGYHMNGIYCLFPPKRRFKTRLAQMVTDFLDAKRKGKQTLKVWTNTFLAQTWDDDVQRVDVVTLSNRTESWGEKLPDPVCLLTMQCDVQANRIEGEIVGWGIGEESWGIERFVVTSSPFKPESWAKLDEYRAKKYETKSGVWLPISACGIDSGGNAKGFGFARAVYAYVLRRKQAGRGQSGVIAIKGSAVVGAPLATEHMQPNGVNLLLVGTDRAKSILMERLKMTEPGPGFMHFPADYGDDFFEQLCAEELKFKEGRRQWVKVRDRNEALDIRVYSLALIDLLNPNWDSLRRIAKIGVAPVNPQHPSSPNAPPKPQLRRRPPKMSWKI